MNVHSTIVILCLGFFGRLCLAQPLPVAPGDVEPLGKLAFEARQKLNDWMGTGDLSELLKRPPAEALAGIQAAAGQMRDYKTAEMRLYDRLGRDLDEDIKLLQTNNVDWKKTFENRAQTIDRDTEGIYDQEQKLQTQVDAISGDTTPAGERYRNELKAQIVQLQQLQMKLAKQHIIYQTVARQESQDGVKSALGGLRAQRQEIDRLKSLSAESRDRLDGFYGHLGDSVREKLPAQQPPARVPATAGGRPSQSAGRQREQTRQQQQTTVERGYKLESKTNTRVPPKDGQGRSASSQGVQTSMRDGGFRVIGKTWLWSKAEKDGDLSGPNRIEFTAVEISGEMLRSKVNLWFSRQMEPDIVGEWNCRIGGPNVTCTGLDSTTFRVSTPNQDPITADMPANLNFFAAGQRRTAQGDRRWEMNGVLALQEKDTRGNRK